VLSDVYTRIGQYERALAEMDRIEALSGFKALTLRNRIMEADSKAFILGNMERYEDALVASERAVGLLNDTIAAGDPVRLSCQSMLARLLIELDRAEEGLARLEDMAKLAMELHGPLSRTSISMQQELTQGYKALGNYEKVIELCDTQIENLSGRMEPGQTQLWNARQVRIEALVELGRMQEAQAAIAELRSLVDLEKSAGRRKRLQRLEAMTGQLQAK
ncbi:MAG: hypothetical protein KDB61_07140, partial [Planctomycetes bacterium]|nr:hypothetical protein [Planctomycetota bacterium]